MDASSSRSRPRAPRRWVAVGLWFTTLELLLCFALVTGIERARRARHSIALLGGAVVAYLFIGPGVAPLRSDAALPLPSVALDQPWLVRVTRSLACSTISGSGRTRLSY